MKAWLASAGFESAFLDKDTTTGIPPGADWERTLYRAGEQSQAMIIIQTPNWLASKWCFAEFTQARALGKAIFPAIVAPTGDTLISPDIQALNPAVPADLAAVLGKLMAKERDRRYQTPEQLVRDLLILAGALGLRSVSPEGLLWMSAAHAPTWERHLVWGIPAVAFAAIVAFLAWWGQDTGGPASSALSLATLPQPPQRAVAGGPGGRPDALREHNRPLACAGPAERLRDDQVIVAWNCIGPLHMLAVRQIWSPLART